MKNINILVLMLLILFIGCSKDDDSMPPVDKLPPLTTVGANTIGCLINGRPLLPYKRNPLGAASFNCFYQYDKNEWLFTLAMSNGEKSYTEYVTIFAKGIILEQGKTYILSNNTTPNMWAHYGITNENKLFTTSNKATGSFKIIKLDIPKNIISGTFSFDAENIDNRSDRVEIREGRFDMTYTP